MSSRFGTAVYIQNACNMRAVAHALVEMIDECRMEGVDVREDSAIAITLDKLTSMHHNPEKFMEHYNNCNDARKERVREHRAEINARSMELV